MRRITLLFMACIMLVSALPAAAAGPYSIRLPASPEGCDPQALTVVGSIQHYRIKKGGDLLEIGIHGTAMPLGVGRLVSHGCTRMYPEHIKQLFPMLPIGTSVEYIYEPVKIGFRQGRTYLSVHEDVYFKIPSMMLHVLNLLEQRRLADQVKCAR